MRRMKDNPILNFLSLPAAIAFSYYLTEPLFDLFGYEMNPWFYLATFFGSIILILYAVFPKREIFYSVNLFLAALAAAAITVFFTPGFCNWFNYNINPLAYVAIFIGSTIFMKFFVFPVTGIGNWGKNKNPHDDRKFNENVSLRRVKGFLMHYFVIVPIMSVVWFSILYYFETINPDFLTRTRESEATIYDIAMIVLLAFLTVFLIMVTQPFKELVGRIVIYLAPRRYKFGRGGSASFGGIFEDWATRYKKGLILVGASLYEPFSRPYSLFKPDGYLIGGKTGKKDDLHLITIANNRGGKGRSAIIPNLIEWPHSALVIDPKGTNAAVTAARRGKGGGRVSKYLGQDVHIVDPFNIVTQNPACFNPLDVIDINSNTVMEDIGLIADALVTEDTGMHGGHFTDNAKIIVSGVIAHLLTTYSNATLLDVQRALTLPDIDQERFFAEMEQNQGAARLPIMAATTLRDAGPNERGSFFTTIKKNTRWIDSAAMKDTLQSSSFKMSDLKNGNTTIYVVLPPHLLNVHLRFMRMFVNLPIIEMSRGAKAKNPVLYVLDEFFSLGTLLQLEQAAGLLASYNVKLWPIVQNIGQLKKNYPNNWETFFENAGIEQFFAISGAETLEYLKERLSKTAYGNVVTYLRETSELAEEIGRDTNRQIILRSGRRPLLLRRTNYDAIFPKNMYSPDPDHPKS